MRRRRSLPWIYRWSRPIIGAIAIAGAVLTAYLTITKLTGTGPVCSAEAAGAGCGGVLDSAYATVFGLPLSLYGCLAYLSMAAFALVPLAISSERQKNRRRQVENLTWWLLLAGSIAMTVFSAYLMYVLATELKTVCPYCIGSALFSLSLLTVTLAGRDWEDLGQILFTGAIVGLLTIVVTLGIYSGVNSSIAQANGTAEEVVDADGLIAIPEPRGNPRPPEGWDLTTTSGAAEIALAEHLAAIGAKKYGAFWCPHCYEQKQLFGKEAFSKIDYVECDPQGQDPQREACLATGIQSYPTWQINGELYPGTKTPAELAELSNFQNETEADFKYKL